MLQKKNSEGGGLFQTWMKFTETAFDFKIVLLLLQVKLERVLLNFEDYCVF